jgi:ParB family chromosome partitioning protein
MVKQRGLGRGLEALLGGGEQVAAGEESLRSLAIDALQPGKYQPRMHMNQEALRELADSIKVQGVMQPVLVRPVAGGRYEIIAGERRWRAARIAGLTNVPALVRAISDQQALAAALIENIQREDLNPLDAAVGIQRLIREFDMTHATAAVALGRSRTAVTNLLRLLELAPPVRELLAEGKLDMGHARALLALPAVRQIELAREAVAKQLSVRQIESRVGGESRKPAARLRPQTDRDVARLEEDLSNRLGTMVSIKAGAKKGSGKLVISYSSLDQLEALLAKLKRD